MFAGGVVVWLAVVGVTVYTLWVSPQRQHPRRAAELLILGGGVALPTVVLAVLLLFGLSMMPDLVAASPDDALVVSVSGEQWWWRIRYQPPGGEPFELANELRLPVGRPVELLLESPDVVHSFWVPALGGKVDMIPGRVNRLRLDPTRTGRFRGVCAEYCGDSHALMTFDVVVGEVSEHEEWMREQARPAAAPRDAATRRGARSFLANGCGACHTVRGTPADGVVGPDLTHVGSRLSVAGGVLPTSADALLRWLTSPEELKPGAHMPSFSMLDDDERRALALYLESLR